jgi:hypothetical protein
MSKKPLDNKFYSYKLQLRTNLIGLHMTSRQYINFNQDQLLRNAETILKSKNGSIAEFGSSGYGKTLIELFTAFSEADAYRTELAWKEGFLSESTQLSSKYLGARDLGYSVRRAVPARAAMTVALKRTGTKPDVKVIIPKDTSFSVNGNNMLSLDDMEFLYNRNDDDGLMRLVSGRAILIEGEYVNKVFFSNGKKNQEFNIFDAGFSNWFGESDPNNTQLDTMKDRINRFTVISSDSGLVDNFTPVEGYEDSIFWKISRRGLYDQFNEDSINDIANFKEGSNLSVNFTALVETANDGNIRISFGDGINATIPYGKINVKYIKTKGANGNISNISGTSITPGGNSVIITQENGQESDLTLDDMTFNLITDVSGGIDIEDGESITKNAPKIFSNLDRLGNNDSYEVFLSREFAIKYANAYGEDVMSRYSVDGRADFKYANNVRYTILKSLYKEKDGTYYTSDPFEYYIAGYKTNGLMYGWEYDYAELPNTDDIIKLEKDNAKIVSNINTGNLVILEPAMVSDINQPSGIRFLAEGTTPFYGVVTLSSPTHTIKVGDYINIDGVSDDVDFEYKVLVVNSDKITIKYPSYGFTKDEFKVTKTMNLITSANTFVKKYASTYIPVSLIPNTLFSADLRPSDFIVDGSELSIIDNKLNKRANLTINKRHVYQHPIVHDFTMKIDIILTSGNSFTKIKSNVINDIYEHLDFDTGFAKDIYRSKIESIILKYPDVIGVNVIFTPIKNGYEGYDLTKYTWLSEETSQIINQSSLSLDGMEINLTYDYNRELVDGTTETLTDRTLRVNLPSQYTLQSQIEHYYRSTFSYTDSVGNTQMKKGGINEEKLNKFTSYIWSTAMNEVYNQLFDAYKDAKSSGYSDNAREIYGVIEAMRGWDTTDGKLQFKDSKLIYNMSEDTSKMFFNYIQYILEYIKMVRKIFAPVTASKLVDVDNNITTYSTENEIVQFQISASDISIKLGK